MNLALLIVGVVLSLAVYAKPVRIGIPQSDTPQRSKVLQQVTLAYQKIGYQPTFIELPSQRRILLLRDGVIDADLFRICELDQNLSDLLVVPVELDTLHLNAYSLNADKLQHWQQNASLMISHIRGFKMAEQQQFTGSRVSVSDAAQAFGLMLQGRVDIVLEDEDTAASFLSEAQQTGSISSVTVASFGVCHILSPQQHALLPLLTDALRNH